MAFPQEKNEFDSWYQTLIENKLKPEQVAVLQRMVAEGQAEDLEKAAEFLDWQDTIIDPLEHMYGF